MWFTHEVLLMLLIAFYTKKVDNLIEFKNLKCISIDKDFSDFEYCYIKAINRTYRYISLKVKLFKTPITNVSVRIDIRKRANGYKPFLYNVTFDACAFLKSRTNPLLKYLHSFIDLYSNMNHSCPYTGDLILEKLPTSRAEFLVTQILPVPKGDYGIFTTWMAYGVKRACVNLFWKII